MISDNIVLAGNLKHPKVDVMREVGVNCREASCNGEAQRVLNIDTVENIRVDCQAATAGKPMGSMLHCRQDNESFSEENGTRMTMWRDWLSKS